MLRRETVKRKSAVLKIAATYIGTVVGAGFATGKEIVEFFLNYGFLGLLGIGLAGFFFIWLGTKTMLLANRHRFPSYQPFNDKLFGRHLGLFINVLILTMLLGSSSVMVAGTGSIFHEQLGLPGQWGIILVLLLCLIAMRKGLNGIFAVNSLVVPIMISFCILITILTFFGDGVHQPSMNIISSQPGPIWIISALTYVSYNLTMAEAVLVPLGKEVNDEHLLKWGGVWGGAGLTFILILSYFVLNQLPNSNHFDIPMAQLVKKYGSGIHFFYVLVIFGEIFTTIIGNVYGLTRQIRRWIEVSEWTIVMCILLICYAISLLDFATLLHYLYRAFGMIGFLLLLFLIFPNPRYEK